MKGKLIPFTFFSSNMGKDGALCSISLCNDVMISLQWPIAENTELKTLISRTVILTMGNMHLLMYSKNLLQSFYMAEVLRAPSNP